MAWRGARETYRGIVANGIIIISISVSSIIAWLKQRVR